MSAKLEHILVAERERRWEFGRCAEGGEGGEVANSDSGSEGPQYSGTKTGDAQLSE